MKIKSLMIAAAMLGTTVTAAPAAAVETVFAQIGLINSNNNFRFVRGNGGNASFYTTSTATANVAGAASITFTLLDAVDPVFTLATLTLSGTTTNDPAIFTIANAPFSQAIDTFSFTIRSAATFVTAGGISITAGDVLLSGTNILNTGISGNLTGTTGSWTGSTLGGSTISYSSPFSSFQNSDFGFAFILGSVAPPFGAQAGRPLNNFRSTISGNFQAIEPFGVPEPSTWAMLIVGMGLVGMARRRRNAAVTA